MLLQQRQDFNLLDYLIPLIDYEYHNRINGNQAQLIHEV
jgi:hypothetical protein